MNMANLNLLIKRWTDAGIVVKRTCSGSHLLLRNPETGKVISLGAKFACKSRVDSTYKRVVRNLLESTA